MLPKHLPRRLRDTTRYRFTAYPDGSVRWGDASPYPNDDWPQDERWREVDLKVELADYLSDRAASDARAIMAITVDRVSSHDSRGTGASPSLR